MQLLPVSHLVSASHQTFPPSSYPFSPTSPSLLTGVLLSSTAAAFPRLQAYSWHWLLHNSRPLSPACLEKHSETDLCFWQKSRENRKRGAIATGKWTRRPLLSYNLFSFVPPVAVTTFLSSLWPQNPVSCSPALQKPPHFLLQPMSGWRRMSSVWCSHNCSSFGSWVCGLPDGLQWLTSSHIHMSSKVEEFSTRCRGLSITPFNNLE